MEYAVKSFTPSEVREGVMETRLNVLAEIGWTFAQMTHVDDTFVVILQKKRCGSSIW